jgi:phosphohistidine phosphatase SixA
MTAGLVLTLALVAAAGLSAPAVAQSGPMTILLVRHAEPGITPGGPLGPSLTEAGKMRAAAPAEIARAEGVTLIVTTRFRRTRETASIVGDALGLKPEITPGDDPGKIVAAQLTAIRAAGDGAALVVGHSDTLPALIARLGGPRLRTICDNAFDRLFKLTGPEGRREFMPSRYGAPSPDPRPNCS